jgi:hypothetical protein
MGAVREAIFCRLKFSVLLALFFAPVAALAWNQHMLQYDFVHMDAPNPAFLSTRDHDQPEDCPADTDSADSLDPTCPD